MAIQAGCADTAVYWWHPQLLKSSASMLPQFVPCFGTGQKITLSITPQVSLVSAAALRSTPHARRSLVAPAGAASDTVSHGLACQVLAVPDWRILAAPLAHAVHIIVPGLAHQRPRAQPGPKIKGAGSKKDGSEQACTLQYT